MHSSLFFLRPFQLLHLAAFPISLLGLVRTLNDRCLFRYLLESDDAHDAAPILQHVLLCGHPHILNRICVSRDLL